MTAPAEGITEETLATIKKAQTTGITTETGITSYDLSGLVSLVPVVTPARDLIPRVKSTDGAKFAIWRSIMNATNAQPDPAVPFDYAASEVVFNEQDFQAQYKNTSLAGVVTQDSYDLATGYADVYAETTFQVLNQVLIGDDRKLIGAQSFALPRPAAPTTSVGTSGTIATETVYVGVAARTGSGYYYGSGNSQGNSSEVTGMTGSANSVTASVPAVTGAVAYDWFQSADGATWYYYTTTTVNTVTMTKTITANQPLPSPVACPDMSTNWQGIAPGQSIVVNGSTVNYAGPATFKASGDNGSANSADYDGLLATLSADYSSTGQWVTPGTGTANPAVNMSLNGAAFTLDGGSVAEIEELFLSIWHQVKCSPTAIMMNAQQAQQIANLILAQPSAVTYLQTDSNGRVNVTGGGRVGSLVNAPAGGVTVPIEVHVSLPPGTVVARTDRVPFPQANIANVLEYRNLRDTSQFDYGISRLPGVPGGGPRREFEIKSLGAFVNRAPVAMGTITSVGLPA